MYEKARKIVPWIWAVISYGWVIGYHIFNGKQMLDSDISAEMVLADLLNKEHSISGLSTNWIYSTGLRFLEMQWLFRLGLLLFPNNWHLARTFAMAIALALMATAAFLVFYAIDRPEWGAWAAAMVIFPGGGWYFWQTIYGGQYTPYILISLFATALILLATRDLSLMRNRIYLVLLFLTGFASGINGIKQLMVFYAPLCITAVLLLVMEIRKCGKDGMGLRGVRRSRRFRFAILSVAASVASLVGYLVNTRLLSRIYMFEEYDQTVIEYRSFFEYLKMFIWDYGFADGKVLMSPSGIASMLGVLFGLLVVGSGVMLIYRQDTLTEEDQMVVFLSIVSILFCCFIFSYVSGHGDIQYFQPVIPFGYFLVVICMNTLKLENEKCRLAITNTIMIILLITSLGTVHNEQNGPFHEYRAKKGLGPVVDWLMAQGYEQGVALFWVSDIVTELSNGKIEMWTLSTDSPEVMLNRLQKKSHLDSLPSGRYFYIFDYSDKENEFQDEQVELGLAYVNAHPEPTELMAIYYDENYVIYGN